MESTTINTATTLQLMPDLLYSKIGDEIVLLTIESGKYFKVDTIGSRIWELIKEPTTIDALCDQLLAEYDTTLEQCQADVIPFLEKLHADQLIKIID